MILILTIDVFLLFSGALADTRAKREQREALDALLIESGSLVTSSHEEINVQRRAALEGLTEVNVFLPIPRTGDEIPKAGENWGDVRAAYSSGQEARLDLVPLTTKILEQASSALEAIAERRVLTEDPKDVELLDALAEAMRSLIATHEQYAVLNEAIVNAYETYDRLVVVIDTFFEEFRAQRFGSDESAAEVYSFRTEDFIDPINKIRDSVNELQAAADVKAAETVEAFLRYEELLAN